LKDRQQELINLGMIAGAGRHQLIEHAAHAASAYVSHQSSRRARAMPRIRPGSRIILREYGGSRPPQRDTAGSRAIAGRTNNAGRRVSLIG
jgi:hypothetical protein